MHAKNWCFTVGAAFSKTWLDATRSYQQELNCGLPSQGIQHSVPLTDTQLYWWWQW